MFVQTVLFGLMWLSHNAVSVAAQEKPGIVLQLTPKTLEIVSNLWTRLLLPNQISWSLNEKMNQTESCVFGICTISHVLVSNDVSPTCNVTFQPDKYINWKIDDAAFDLVLFFSFTAPDGAESGYVSGEATVTLSGVSLEAMYSLDRGSDGKLLISLTNSSVNIRAVNSELINGMDIFGNFSKFQGLSNGNETEIHRYLEDRLNESVSTALYQLADQVSRMFPDGLDEINKYLASSVGFVFDGTLTKDILFTSEHVELDLRAKFHLVGEDADASIQPPDFDIPPANSSMFGVYISDYTLNTLLSCVFKKRLMSVNITDDFLLSSIYSYYQNPFDTSCDDTFCFKNIFPNVISDNETTYENASVKFSFKVTSRPSLTFSFKTIAAEAGIDLTIVVSDYNSGSEEVLATLPMSIFKSDVVSFLTFRERLAYIFTNPNITVTDKGSPKEFIDYVSRLEFLLQTIQESVVNTWLNLFGGFGTPLMLSPSGVSLRHTELGFKKGVFGFSTDILYDRTASDIYPVWRGSSIYTSLATGSTIMDVLFRTSSSATASTTQWPWVKLENTTPRGESKTMPTKAEGKTMPTTAASKSMPTKEEGKTMPTKATSKSMPTKEEGKTMPTKATSKSMPTTAKI